MEQLSCKHRSSSVDAEGQLCRQAESRSTQLPRMSVMRHLLLLSITFLVYTLDSAKAYGATETLCGGELVDTLQFVCGDRGFYFSRNNGRSNRRANRGIVEECCFRSCDLELLETYCAKPAKNERDVSTAPSTAIPPLNKDLYHKHHHTKSSKYDIWQRKSIHRLRRGVPAIVRARQYRLLMQQAEESEQALSHRPLTTLPITRPLHLQQTSEPSLN
ncbi:insulin-like growth factor II isoform X2 [Xenopus tropicalis]|uniref:Insulin-like growth factor II isoform X2 n=1 Tax=Xenopus tropicalis TaxID=8364 RepID=A0A8J0SJ94_XENTR|nr:insulin-like growth factor II isoform X2 [Xenopus tropicalis]|eukprot:XP_012816009.1 PREDICTED: insulin-like growth factor II isoform X2 [Xenopus tropicalis]